MTSLINIFHDWPPNHHEMAKTFPQISWASLLNDYADSKRASNNICPNSQENGSEGGSHSSLTYHHPAKRSTF